MAVYVSVKALRLFVQGNGSSSESIACDRSNHVANIWAEYAVGNLLHIKGRSFAD